MAWNPLGSRAQFPTARDALSGPGTVGAKGTTFAEAIQAWFDDDCPNVSPTRKSRHARPKSPNTIANARQLLGTSVLPVIGNLRVDQTTTQRLEELFQSMAAREYATSTIDRNWNYLNQALQHAHRDRRIKTNPAADVLLPAIRPSKERKSFSIEQAKTLLTVAIPADARPAMWLTGLMCGLRPGEIAGLRWPYVDLDSDEPSIEIAERALEVDDEHAASISKPGGPRRHPNDRGLSPQRAPESPRRHRHLGQLRRKRQTQMSSTNPTDAHQRRR